MKKYWTIAFLIAISDLIGQSSEHAIADMIRAY